MPTVEVVPRLLTPQFDLTTPREQLTLAAEVSRPGEADGITNFRVTSELTMQENSHPGGCPVSGVQVTIKQLQLDVYIAKEVPQSSCRFRAVYDHELKHVMLAQRSMDQSMAPLRRKLVAVLGTAARAEVQDFAALREALSAIVVSHLDALTAAYAKGNEALDTPAEGRRLAEMCEDPKTYLGSVGLPSSASPAVRSNQ